MRRAQRLRWLITTISIVFILIVLSVASVSASEPSIGTKDELGNTKRSVSQQQGIQFSDLGKQTGVLEIFPFPRQRFELPVYFGKQDIALHEPNN